MAVKIIIDSSSDIGVIEAGELGVTMVPMVITFGSEEFLDGVNLSTDEFYNKLETSAELPQTSLINEFRWNEVFEEATKNGDEVVAITISSKLSGTFNAAVSAAKKFSDRVQVVDSLNACSGEGILCKYAVSLAKKGMSAKEIKKELDSAKLKVRVYAMIGTLEYLKKGGRISAAAAFAGSLLSLKPIISVTDGEVKVVSKAMGLKNGKAAVVKYVQSGSGFDLEKPYALVCSGVDRAAINKFKEENLSLWGGDQNIEIKCLGGTIGTHIGPGAVGVAYFEK